MFQLNNQEKPLESTSEKEILSDKKLDELYNFMSGFDDGKINEFLRNVAGKFGSLELLEAMPDATVWLLNKKLMSEKDAKAEEELRRNVRDSATYLEEYSPWNYESETKDESVKRSFIIMLRRYAQNLYGGQGIDMAAYREISEKRKSEVERFLLGESAYEKRVSRLKKKYGQEIPKEELEAYRKHLVGVFFKALAHNSAKKEHPVETWRDIKGPFYNFQEKALDAMLFSAYQPVRTTIRLLEKMGKENFLLEKGTIDGEESLADYFQIERLKQELESVKTEGNVDEVSEKIVEIVDQLSTATKKAFKYNVGSNELSKMKETKTANCVGYAVIGSTLLRELGIPMVGIGGKTHAFIGYTTPNGKFLVNHFQGDFSVKVNNDDLDGRTVDDLTSFTNQEQKNVLPVKISLEAPLNWWNKDEGMHFQQEVIYLFKNMDADFLEHARFLSREDGFNRQALLGKEAASSSYLAGPSKEEIKTAIESNPDDPSLFRALDWQETLDWDSKNTKWTEEDGKMKMVREEGLRGGAAMDRLIELTKNAKKASLSRRIKHRFNVLFNKLKLKFK